MHMQVILQLLTQNDTQNMHRCIHTYTNARSVANNGLLGLPELFTWVTYIRRWLLKASQRKL